MTIIKIIILTLLICTMQQGSAQNAKFYFIKDADTLTPQETKVKVFLDVGNQLLSFNSSDSLIFPSAISPDSINSVIIVYQSDTLSFFNFREKLKVRPVSTPIELIRMQLPIYHSIFEDKRNMYFSVDKYPFENDLRKEIASANAENAKLPINRITIVELDYQLTETTTLEPRPKNNR